MSEANGSATEWSPRLVSWNLTRRCNLDCPHCYIEAGRRVSGRGEMTTPEALRFVDQLAALCPGAMLVFSGGEPLMRADLGSLVSHAAREGLLPVLGTNGVLLTPSRARELVDCGLQGVGLSIDSLDAGKHDDFRGVPGAWRRTVSAIGTCQRLGLAVQIHTTATRANHVEIPELIEFAVDRGVDAFNLFFLVCTGRGQKMTDIGPARYEALLRLLATTQETYRGRMLIRARCAPHYLRLVHGHGAELAAATAGCMAGTEYLRVTPEADVTPCPYLPIVAGNLRVDSLASIWESAPVLNELRSPKLTGRCGACEYGRVCGGCRARAFATTGDLMAEDPWCDYEPGQLGPMALADLGPETAGEPEWSEEARGRLDRVPVALRPVVERGVVAYARSKGLGRITPELMREMRSRVGRMGTLSKHSSPPGE